MSSFRRKAWPIQGRARGEGGNWADVVKNALVFGTRKDSVNLASAYKLDIVLSNVTGKEEKSNENCFHGCDGVVRLA